jgi:hypothetical protein
VIELNKGGRPALTKGQRRKGVCVSLSEEDRTYYRRNGGSKFIRELIERHRNETNIQSGLAGVSNVPVVSPTTRG